MTDPTSFDFNDHADIASEKCAACGHEQLFPKRPWAGLPYRAVGVFKWPAWVSIIKRLGRYW